MTSYRDFSKPGDVVARRRLEVKLTQRDLSRAMSYANSNFISMIEKGTAKVPVHRALEFADLLEMDRAWFLERVLRDHYPETAEWLFSQTTLEQLLAARSPASVQAGTIAQEDSV